MQKRNLSFGTLLFEVESLELITRKRPAFVSGSRGTTQRGISIECFRSWTSLVTC